MKLISMTQKVIELNRIHEIQYDDLWDKAFHNAKFRTKQLELGDLVTCDEDGDVMLIPGSSPIYTHSLEYIKEYQKAKDKVLFEGFKYAETHSIGMEKGLDLFVFPYTETKIGLTKKEEGFRTWFKLETIEDLVQCDLIITPQAIKRFNL